MRTCTAMPRAGVSTFNAASAREKAKAYTALELLAEGSRRLGAISHYVFAPSVLEEAI